MPDEARPRRKSGEPRRLLVEAAQELFNRKGYASTSTREVAVRATVSEALIYRYFGSKAGLFRAAMVQPFIDTLDDEIAMLGARQPSDTLSRKEVWTFVASMYDIFHEHRALAAMVFAADALIESEVAESGMIDDVRSAIDRFVTASAIHARAGGVAIDPAAHDLAIRGHMAMVAGVATFGSWYLGRRRPKRAAIIDELTTWVLLRYEYGQRVAVQPPPATATASRSKRATTSSVRRAFR
jgi:AcrR family transcriptional regulator